MEQTKLFYRRWESKYSPHNRAVREAQSIAANERSRARRNERQAERRAIQAAHMADPVTLAGRAEAQAHPATIAALMSAPRRTPVHRLQASAA